MTTEKQQSKRDYRDWQLGKLTDPSIAASYLTEAFADSPRVFLKALRNVAQSSLSVAQVAKEAGVTRETLYRGGNLTVKTLTSILDVLDIDVIFMPRESSKEDEDEFNL